MTAITRGLKSFFRRSRNSIIYSIFFCLVSFALFLSSVIGETSRMYREQNENPYSDYYRVILDYENTGYSSLDYMNVGYQSDVDRFLELYRDITDYTLECMMDPAKPFTEGIEPFMLEWSEDKGFVFYGITDCKAISEFYKGKYTLASGRYITINDRKNNNHVCMISEKLAEKNNLSIGDSITYLDYIINDDGEIVVERFELEIVGTYNTPAGNYNDVQHKNTQKLVENNIYIPYSVFRQHNMFGFPFNLQIKPDDDLLIDEIEKHANDYGVLGYTVRFIKVSDLYSGQNIGIHTMETALEIIRYAFIIVSLLVVSVFSTSMLKARKREFGIYLALGDSKRNIITAVIIELLVSLVIGFSIAAGCVYKWGTTISTAMLRYATGNINAELLKNTTSEFLLESQKTNEVIEAVLNRSFVTSCIADSLLTIFIVFAVAALVSAIRIVRTSAITLLSDSEVE